jgi:hypothetical protein
MEIKESTQKPQKREFNSIANICLSAYCKDEPIAIRVIPSGWNDLYHVLIEFGDFEDATYKGLFSSEQIGEEYGINLPKGDSFSLSSLSKRVPNDHDLGKFTRTLVGKFENKMMI